MTTTPASHKLSLSFIFILLGYFALQIVLRVFISDSLDYDEAEQALLGQWLLAGYTEQPPLYTWVQYFLFKIFGQGVFAISLLKNTLLFLTYLFVYLSATQLFKNTRAAILSASSLLLIPQIAWESQRDMTHTTLVVCAAAALFWIVLKLIENRSAFNYCLLGLFFGIGVLAKANFALFIVVLTLTLLTFPEGRRIICSRKILFSLLISVAITASYFLWMFNNQEIVFSATHKLKRAAELYYISGITSFIKNGFLFLTPLWLVYLIIFPAGFLKNQNKQPSIYNRFLGRYGLFFLLTLLIIILAFKVSYVKDRWLQPLLFLAPLIFFSRIELKNITEKKYKLFLKITATAAISVYIAFTVRAIDPPFSDHYSRLSYPISSFAEDMRESGFNGGLIVSNNRFLAGNMRIKFPDSTALIPDFNFENLLYSSSHSQAAVIWKADSTPQIPVKLHTFLQETYDINPNDYPITYHEEFYKHSKEFKVKLALLIFPLGGASQQPSTPQP